ncbi:MAG: 2-oxo acid dehydrogenase subunit E2 [Chloroflexi bacterium]|nr:2-oxo acid dehydrogenase subunit E2 [Chloroflexota bacterium]
MLVRNVFFLVAAWEIVELSEPNFQIFASARIVRHSPGEILIHPTMNVALSYDHRVIDGQQAVGFLKRIKTYIEDPEEMLLER